LSTLVDRNTAQLLELEARWGAHNYAPLPVVIARGEGVWVYDTEGRRYLDCLSAYSAVNQGHAHPTILAALQEQASRVTLTSRAFHNDQLPLLCYELAQLTRQDVVLPMNTGAEAVETAIKAARRWAYERKGVPRDGAEVIVCASSAEKLARLRDLGADHGIDYAKEDFVKWVYGKYGKPHRRRFDGGVDVVVNFTGGDTWVPSLKVLHRQGRVLTCGATAGFDPKEDLRFIWTFELNIRGANGWMREDLATLLDLIGSGKLEPIVDRELELPDANEAFRLLEERIVFGKVLVKP